MTKVVINNQTGGYSLSEKAIELLRERGYEIDSPYTVIPRHNKDLVEVVELLGAEADGEYPSLVIEELPDKYSEYVIADECGCEILITPDDEEWGDYYSWEIEKI